MRKILIFLFIIIFFTCAASAGVTYGNGWKNDCSGGKCIYLNHVTYLRWDGVWIPAEQLNIENGNWSYLKQENSSHYILKRLDDSLILPKNFAQYSFGNNRISMQFTVTPAQLNTRSTKVGSNWYIEIPEAVLKTRFLWDNQKPVISNESGSVLDSETFLYQRYDGKYYLGYNQTARDFGISSSTITFSFHSWTLGEGGDSWTGFATFNNFMLDKDTNQIGLPIAVTDGLVLYLPFNGASGTTAYNMNLTSNFDATLINMSSGVDNGSSGWNSTRCKDKNCISFDGVDDLVRIVNNSLLSSNDYTVLAWINSTAMQVSSQYVWLGQNSNGDVKGQLALLTNSLFSFDDYLPSGGSLASNTVLNYKQFYHTGIVRNGTGRYIYVNGSLDAYNLSSETYAGGVISEYLVGMRWMNVATKYPFYGTIDEVYRYNRVLNISEINSIKNGTRATYDILTTTYDAEAGYETYQIIINASSQAESNYSVFYRNSGSGTWIAIGTPNSTGNQTISLASFTRYQNTDLKIELYGNGTSNTYVSSIYFYSLTYQGTITGNISDKVSIGVENALITLDNDQSTYSDSNGFFNFSGVSSGSHRITVKALEYEDKNYDFYYPDTDNIDLELVHFSEIFMNLGYIALLLGFISLSYSRKNIFLSMGAFAYALWYWSTQIDHGQEYAYFLTGAFLFVWVGLMLRSYYVLRGHTIN